MKENVDGDQEKRTEWRDSRGWEENITNNGEQDGEQEKMLCSSVFIAAYNRWLRCYRLPQRMSSRISFQLTASYLKSINSPTKSQKRSNKT
ncbi:hypothetical protein AMECASPLE_005999 [Ameca splendens]|uniref:Uncharacterized protein n=1 Tax=Ameca splendens TaxID=208324 RepID=A0ABV1A777_9TELE